MYKWARESCAVAKIDDLAHCDHVDGSDQRHVWTVAFLTHTTSSSSEGSAHRSNDRKVDAADDVAPEKSIDAYAVHTAPSSFHRFVFTQNRWNS